MGNFMPDGLELPDPANMFVLTSNASQALTLM